MIEQKILTRDTTESGESLNTFSERITAVVELFVRGGFTIIAITAFGENHVVIFYNTN